MFAKNLLFFRTYAIATKVLMDNILHNSLSETQNSRTKEKGNIKIEAKKVRQLTNQYKNVNFTNVPTFFSSFSNCKVFKKW